MTVETKDEHYSPDQVRLVCMHRSRRVNSQPRRLESSCNIASRHLIVWPEQMAEQLEFETTMYSTGSNVPDNKDWTLYLEGWMTKTKNGKTKHAHKLLASADLNMKTLICQPRKQAEVQLIMRPLDDRIKYCRLDMLVITVHSEVAETSSLTIQSIGNKTEEPNKEEVEALIASMNVVKQPDLTPRTSRITRQQSANSPLMEKAHETQQVLQQIAHKNEIEEQDQMVPSKIPDYEKGSSELTDNHQRLVGDKDQLSRRQDFLNVQLDLNETKIAHLPCLTTNSSTPCRQLPKEKKPSSDNGFMPANSRLPSFRSIGRKPEEPNKEEVEALIASMIAAKRPDLTPRTSRITRQQSANSPLMEKAREIQQELQQIAHQIDEIEEQDQMVLSKIPDYEKDSNEESELIEHHQRLVGDKDQLSRRQDFLNVQLDLNETEFKIAHLRSLLAAGESSDEVDGGGGGPPASHWSTPNRRDSNVLLLELKELMDQKDELTHQLSDMEAEDEEGEERNRMILERARNQKFLRAHEEPLNVSKRLISWISGVEQRFKYQQIMPDTV